MLCFLNINKLSKPSCNSRNKMLMNKNILLWSCKDFINVSHYCMQLDAAFHVSFQISISSITNWKIIISSFSYNRLISILTVKIWKKLNDGSCQINSWFIIMILIFVIILCRCLASPVKNFGYFERDIMKLWIIKLFPCYS